MQYPTIHMPGRARDWGGGGEHRGWMAVTWALLAFFGGAMVGMMAGKKQNPMYGSGGAGGGMPMWKHHHHGFGQPSCHMRHTATEPVAPGAVGEQPHERNEGE